MRTLFRIERTVIRAEKVVIGVAMGLLLFAGLFQVIVRVVGARSLGTDEIASFAMITLIFIGAALTTATGDSIAVEVADFVPSTRVRMIIGIVVKVIVVVFGVTFTYYAFELMNVALETGEQSLQLGIPKALPTGVMAAAGALLTVHAVLRLIGAFAPKQEAAGMGRAADIPGTEL